MDAADAKRQMLAVSGVYHAYTDQGPTSPMLRVGSPTPG